MTGQPIMSVVDDLMAQRDVILFGTWVKHAPKNPNEACLVLRTSSALITCSCGCGGQFFTFGLQSLSLWYVQKILEGRGIFSTLPAWNDDSATRVEVLDVLDEAIRLAKEDSA